MGRYDFWGSVLKDLTNNTGMYHRHQLTWWDIAGIFSYRMHGQLNALILVIRWYLDLSRSRGETKLWILWIKEPRGREVIQGLICSDELWQKKPDSLDERGMLSRCHRKQDVALLFLGHESKPVQFCAWNFGVSDFEHIFPHIVGTAACWPPHIEPP